jgi:hypothetical protein
VATANITATAVTNRVIDFIGVSSRVGSDAQRDNSVQCIPYHTVSKWRRCTGHHASLSAMNTVSDMVPATKRVRVSPLLH